MRVDNVVSGSALNLFDIDRRACVGDKIDGRCHRCTVCKYVEVKPSRGNPCVSKNCVIAVAAKYDIATGSVAVVGSKSIVIVTAIHQVATGISTTHYVAGGAYEVVTDPTGKRTRKATIAGVAMVIDEVTGATVTPVGIRYLLKDHLGSVDVVTDQTGAVLDRMSFDAWGRRRNIDWTALVGSVSDAYPWQSQLVTRGYTFHEQLDPIGLIHMNGRVYDAEIGRFLSADAVIQDISNSQALNAYSYVQNNPLSFTDPSGFFLSGLFHKIGNFFRSVAHAIGRVVRSSVFRSVLTILACATPGVNVVACAAMAATISFGGALVDGGSFGDAIRSASVAFFSAGLFQGGGDFLQGLGLGGNIFARAAVQGTIGGAMSVMGGGSFSAGFYSNAFGAVANGFTEGLGDAGFGRIGRIAIAAAAGGTASVLAGGKFANGAMSAAFALMYNDMGHEGLPGTQSGETAYSSRIDDVGLGDPMYDALAAVTPTGECWQAECSLGAVVFSAAVGAMPAGKFTRGLASNPFFGKTANEIAEILTRKGFLPKGLDPLNGQGTFLNTRTGRSYHLDLNHPPGKAPHVGINRPRGYNGPLEAKDKFVD
jgi:RHS repeat-associated protein